jgi:hypothetical protein
VNSDPSGQAEGACHLFRADRSSPSPPISSRAFRKSVWSRAIARSRMPEAFRASKRVRTLTVGPGADRGIAIASGQTRRVDTVCHDADPRGREPTLGMQVVRQGTRRRRAPDEWPREPAISPAVAGRGEKREVVDGRAA